MLYTVIESDAGLQSIAMWYIEQTNQRGNIDDVCQVLASSVVCIVSIHQERILGAAHDTYGAHITGASLALKVLRMLPGRTPQLLLLRSAVARARSVAKCI